MSRDGARPGDFMLQSVNCPCEKLGREFPRVSFRGHLCTLPKLMEITSSSCSSKSVWRCCCCSLADRIYPYKYFIAIRVMLCCTLFCWSVVTCWFLCDSCWANGVIHHGFYSWNQEQNTDIEKLRLIPWCCFTTCMKSRDYTKHTTVVKVILAII